MQDIAVTTGAEAEGTVVQISFNVTVPREAVEAGSAGVDAYARSWARAMMSHPSAITMIALKIRWAMQRELLGH